MMQRPAFQMSSSHLLPAGMPEGALQAAGGGCHPKSPSAVVPVCYTVAWAGKCPQCNGGRSGIG